MTDGVNVAVLNIDITAGEDELEDIPDDNEVQDECHANYGPVVHISVDGDIFGLDR
jgi:hypothetical protein